MYKSKVVRHTKLLFPCRRMSNRNRRRSLNGDKCRKRLIRIGERDNWTCQLCGGPITPIARKDPGIGTCANLHRASVDHIQPVAIGGSEDDDNLRIAHQSCNGYINGDNNRPFRPFDRTSYMWDGLSMDLDSKVTG